MTLLTLERRIWYHTPQGVPRSEAGVVTVAIRPEAAPVRPTGSVRTTLREPGSHQTGRPVHLHSVFPS